MIFVSFLLFGCTATKGVDTAHSGETHADTSAVGSAASVIIGPEGGDMVIEADGVADRIAGDGVFDAFFAVLGPHTRFTAPPERVHGDEIDAGLTGGVWTLSDVREVEAKYRQSPPLSDDGTVSLYMLFVDGAEADENVMARAYSGTSMVVYKDAISAVCMDQRRWIEDEEVAENFCSAMITASLVHEVGHLVGLVDVGTPMVGDHADAAHPGHCSNPDCIMYYSNVTERLGEWLVDFINADPGSVAHFDDACIQDIGTAWRD